MYMYMYCVVCTVHDMLCYMLFVETFLIIDMASDERNRGYLTSSLTILSNTSSSSSPGNGD